MRSKTIHATECLESSEIRDTSDQKRKQNVKRLKTGFSCMCVRKAVRPLSGPFPHPPQQENIRSLILWETRSLFK